MGWKVWMLLITFAELQYPLQGTHVKLALIAVIRDPKSWMSVMNSGSAINIAYDDLIHDGVISNDSSSSLSIVWRDTYLQSEGVGNVVDLVKNEDVDVIFGSVSSREPSAHLTSFWNFPHVTYGSNSFELSDKKLFTTLIRTQGPLSEVGGAMVSLFKKFDWRKLGMLHIDYGVCQYSAAGIKEEFSMNNITIMQSIAYPPNTILTTDIIDSYMALIKQTSRIIFICVDAELRRYLVRACKFGMCNGEFLFILTTLNQPDGSIWFTGDADDHYAKMGFRYLIYIASAIWYGDDGKRRLDKFNVDVIDRMSMPPWNNSYAKLNNITASSFAQYLYDATYFYGLWLNHSNTVGINIRNGSAMMAYSRGLSFNGISGPCDIGHNGDRIPYFWIYEFLGDERRPEIVAIAKTKDKIITETTGFHWFTTNGLPPKDTPDCGFFQELCPVFLEDNTVTVIATCLSVLAVISMVAVIGYIIRKRQIENVMMKSIWKVNINDIELQKANFRMGSRINIANASASRNMSIASIETHLGTTEAVSMTVGMFKGQTVFIRNVKNIHLHLTREELIELKTMREMMHDNINAFVGACFDTPSPCVLFIYCPKGSLQDILENDDITLDISFKYSLMMDLVQGMFYLHNSKLGSHGRLKSTNCLVDTRWVLKITDYGLGKYINNIIPLKIEENQMYKSLLWTAPELLSVTPGLYPAGTKEGDIYSLSIILHEIVYRLGPFAGKAHMTAKDVIERVKNTKGPPCRPEIFVDVNDIAPSIVKLMQLCWNENQYERPSITVIRSYIKKNIPGITKNIMDIVLQRLEKYASNLENLVDQRTQQLMQEKQKTDRLLYRMLPPSCADKLKIGEPVYPEIYEAATVFFSDIEGFTTIASESKPEEVVDFLNDLYTCFDNIISKHDAYKVETIGDAYLVVSGIPKRNGELHAGVVGLSMPKYCVFGDTVNTASRMETNGKSQKIHVSEAGFKALQKLGGFYTTLRGDMPIKGKGMMTTYWLEGKEGRTPYELID